MRTAASIASSPRFFRPVQGRFARYDRRMVQRVPVHMTYAEYLAAEDKADMKHEYLRGEVFAMSGGTPEHAALTAAVIANLSRVLSGKPCRVYSSDLRVRIPETDLSTYPDVTIVCGKLETAKDDGNAAVNPTVIVEVLSPSTEGYDRGEKSAHYRRIASLKELVLVAQDRRSIEIYRRNAQARWELAVEAGAGQRAELESVGAVLDVEALYANPIE